MTIYNLGARKQGNESDSPGGPSGCLSASTGHPTITFSPAPYPVQCGCDAEACSMLTCQRVYLKFIHQACNAWRPGHRCKSLSWGLPGEAWVVNTAYNHG